MSDLRRFNELYDLLKYKGIILRWEKRIHDFSYLLTPEHLLNNLLVCFEGHRIVHCYVEENTLYYSFESPKPQPTAIPRTPDSTLLHKAVYLYRDLLKLYQKLDDDELGEAVEERVAEEFDAMGPVQMDMLKEELHALHKNLQNKKKPTSS